MARLLINGTYVGKYNNEAEAQEVAKFYLLINKLNASDLVYTEIDGQRKQGIVGYKNNVVFI